MDVEPGLARLLAIRDEDPDRPWDDLGAWWPDAYPGVIGIRDRRAGGAWLAINPATGRFAVLLNRADEIDIADDEVLSRGSLVLESVAGRPPVAPRTHGFNLLEATADGVRVHSWDGVKLTSTAVDTGVHMIAHDGLDDPATARIEAWLPRFRSTPVADWTQLLGETARLSADDDRAIIRDNRSHGYPTLSLLFSNVEITARGIDIDSTTLARPGEWG